MWKLYGYILISLDYFSLLRLAMFIFCLRFIFLFHCSPWCSLPSGRCPECVALGARERDSSYPSYNTLISCSNLDNWIWMTLAVFYYISKSFPILYSQRFSMYIYMIFFLAYIFIFSASQIFTRVAGSHTRHWLAGPLPPALRRPPSFPQTRRPDTSETTPLPLDM